MPIPRTADGRIPSLDGLRAISILMVILSHVAGVRDGVETLMVFRTWGSLGVRVFFVISGFLITTLLLGEMKRHGTVSLKSFYYRRVLRIFPANYAFIAALAVATLLGAVAVPVRDLVLASVYLTNYNVHHSWEIAHLWSLAVEEQFYLLWPAALKFLGRDNALRAAGAVLLLAPCLRVIEFWFLPALRPQVGHSFETVMDALATGCLLSGLWFWLEAQPVYMDFLRSRAFWLVPLAILGCSYLDRYSRLYLPFAETAMNAGTALVIHRFVRFPIGRVAAFLNWKPFAFIGVLSYSLYLAQQPFLNRNSDAWWTALPVNLVLMVLFALASFYLIEQPFVRLRVKARTESAS